MKELARLLTENPFLILFFVSLFVTLSLFVSDSITLRRNVVGIAIALPKLSIFWPAAALLSVGLLTFLIVPIFH